MNEILEKIKHIQGWMTENELLKLAELVSGISNIENIIEIGSDRGLSSSLIAHSAHNGLLYCIDIWSEETIYEDFVRNTFIHHKKIFPIKANSIKASMLFPDEYADLIFIDADHSYDAVKADLAAWWPKLKNGGVFCGHDYCNEFNGVIDAVNEFSIEKNIDIKQYYNNAEYNSIWHCRKV